MCCHSRRHTIGPLGHVTSGWAEALLLRPPGLAGGPQGEGLTGSVAGSCVPVLQLAAGFV